MVSWAPKVLLQSLLCPLGEVLAIPSETLRMADLVGGEGRCVCCRQALSSSLPEQQGGRQCGGPGSQHSRPRKEQV